MKIRRIMDGRKQQEKEKKKKKDRELFHNNQRKTLNRTHLCTDLGIATQAHGFFLFLENKNFIWVI